MMVRVVDFGGLRGFPTYDGANATKLADDATIRVGLSKPSH